MNIRRSWDYLRQFTSTLLRNIFDDKIFFRGTSLAFTSTITLVPVIMVIFSFGGFDQLGLRVLDGLSRFLLPESSDEIYDAFKTFTLNARRLGTLGSVAFLFSALFMLNAMETHLNDIFRVKHHRGPVARIGIYIASLALISFIFGSGYGPISGLMDAWHKVPPVWQRVLGIFLSFLGALSGMMMLFNLMSAAKMKFHASLVGALVGALSFQAAKFVFAFWMQRSVRQSVIYGSVVFIPKLLLWMATAWIIFLIAAEITYAVQIKAGRRTPYRKGSPADETEIGWQLFLTLAGDFRDGRTPPSVRNLAYRLAAPESRVGEMIQRMESCELIQAVRGRPTSFIPAMALTEIKASTVIAVVSGWETHNEFEEDREMPVLLKDGISQVLGTRSVESFLSEENPPDPA